MATPRNSARSQPRSASQSSAPSARLTYNRNDPNHLTVDPRWLAKVFGLTVVAAFFCAYLAMCLLFWLGSWQWVLHPTHNAGAGTGLPSQIVHFGPDAGGTPQLTGEWLPADATSTAANTSSTVLYLRPGDGQLDFADAPTLQTLHTLGLNVLAFDYRGYGRSALHPHPADERMQQDAEAAWAYLTGLRQVASQHILLYGAGTGASLAATLAAAHPDAAAVILRDATADVPGTIASQKRSRYFPVRLLLHDRFSLDALTRDKQPKLLFDIGPNDGGPENAARVAAYRGAADPKVTVTLPTADPAKEAEALHRFLDAQVAVLPPSIPSK